MPRGTNGRRCAGNTPGNAYHHRNRTPPVRHEDSRANWPHWRTHPPATLSQQIAAERDSACLPPAFAISRCVSLASTMANRLHTSVACSVCGVVNRTGCMPCSATRDSQQPTIIMSHRCNFCMQQGHPVEGARTSQSADVVSISLSKRVRSSAQLEWTFSLSAPDEIDYGSCLQRRATCSAVSAWLAIYREPLQPVQTIHE